MAFCNVCKSNISSLEKWNYRNMCEPCFRKFQTTNASFRIIQDSFKILNNTKNPETGINRVLLVMFHLDFLTPFVVSKIIELPDLSEMKASMRKQYNVYKDQLEQSNITKKKKVIIPSFDSYKKLYG